MTGDDDAGRFGARGNVTQHIGHSFEISGNGGYLRTSAGLPPRGSILDKTNVIANGLFGSAVQDSLQGYQEAFGSTSTRERADHWTGGATAAWDAFGLLQFSGLYGRDNIAERDERLGDRGGTGVVDEQATFDHSLTTVALSVRTADVTLFHPSLRTRTVLGYDQLRSKLIARDSTAYRIDPNIFSTAGLGLGARIAGKSLRQEFSWSDRLLMGLGVRWERWSAGLPQHFTRSSDVSWLVGHAAHLDSLRLRAAYGEASNWTPGLPQWAGAPTSGINPMFLPPDERVKEGELGADFAFGDRARFSLTAFRTDASHLYAFQSAVGPIGPPFSINDGALRNQGLELASQLGVLRTAWFRWDATVRASTLRERTRSIGPDGSGNALFEAPGEISIPGGVVNGYFGRTYSYSDANHDGLISANELQFSNFAPISAGTSLPTREASVLSIWTFHRGLSLSALVDYRGGQKLANMNEAFRCLNRQNCLTVNDPSASLAAQAQAVAGYYSPLPYVEGASFAKLREVSLRWTVPSRFSGFLGAPSSITVAGRNLATWTHYRGIDPELNVQPVDVLPRVDWAETPIPREFLVRLDFGGSFGGR